MLTWKLAWRNLFRNRRRTLTAIVTIGSDDFAFAVSASGLAVVPKDGTLQDVRARQALARAELLIKEKLESSAHANVRPRERERRKERLAAKLLRGSRRKLWQVSSPRRPSAKPRTAKR